MHEMSIATSLMEQLQRIAAERDARSITEVEVVCGVMQQVVPEALELAFETLAQDTLAASATLRIIEEPLAGTCRGCEREYVPDLNDFRCPKCELADPELTAGQDIILKTVVMETDDKAAQP